ncbi:MAG: hypothetical protein IJD23_05490 [Spirochaetaceae bacterium]|nr:hypothetical protein [Spirochaetaceae bacterium]
MTKIKFNLLIFLVSIGIIVSFATCKQSEIEEPKTCCISYNTTLGPRPEGIYVQENTVLSESELPELETLGYTFDGWYDVSEIIKSDNYEGDLSVLESMLSYTKKILPGYIVTDDLCLFAKWIPNNYVVKFDKNAEDATGFMDDLIVPSDQQFKLPENMFNREG